MVLILVIFAALCTSQLSAAEDDFPTDRLSAQMKAAGNIELRVAALGRVETHSMSLIQYDAPSMADVDEFATICADELAIYPAEFFELACLRRVVLCSNLRHNGEPKSGLADIHAGFIYYDVEYLIGSDDYFCRMTIHHEIYHLVDWAKDRSLDDWNWEALNYRSGIKQPETVAGIKDEPSHRPKKGFISRYAATNTAEDKAETFAHMILSYSYFTERAKRDFLLKKKSAMIELTLQEYIPAIDESFWCARYCDSRLLP